MLCWGQDTERLGCTGGDWDVLGTGSTRGVGWVWLGCRGKWVPRVLGARGLCHPWGSGCPGDLGTLGCPCGSGCPGVPLVIGCPGVTLGTGCPAVSLRDQMPWGALGIKLPWAASKRLGALGYHGDWVPWGAPGDWVPWGVPGDWWPGCGGPAGAHRC